MEQHIPVTPPKQTSTPPNPQKEDHESQDPQPSPSPSPPPQPQPLLTVYSFDANPRKYSYSPYVTKLHFRLRHAGVPYTNGFGSRTQAPMGKIPYVVFHESGEVMGDSGLIIKRLVEMGVVGDVDEVAGLRGEERAGDWCLRGVVEEAVYYLTLYERWYDNYYAMRDRGPFAPLPYGIRHVVAALAFRYVRVMLYMQGTGRYGADEVARLREEAIGALARFADAAREKRCGEDGEEGGKDYREPFWILGGEKPTEADFTVFGYLSGALVTVTQPATTALIKSYPSLVDYVERIHEKYFPDFEDFIGRDTVE